MTIVALQSDMSFGLNCAVHNMKQVQNCTDFLNFSPFRWCLNSVGYYAEFRNHTQLTQMIKSH